MFTLNELDNYISEIPEYVYHGGDCDNISNLYKNFNMLSSEEKLKLPSTGGGNFGLSTSLDKNIAKRYSSVFGCKNILKIKVDPKSKFKTIDTNGDGIDEFYFPDDMQQLKNDGYDAIMDSGNQSESEIRILNFEMFKPISIEI
jgi:hypothetical protein